MPRPVAPRRTDLARLFAFFCLFPSALTCDLDCYVVDKR